MDGSALCRLVMVVLMEYALIGLEFFQAVARALCERLLLRMMRTSLAYWQHFREVLLRLELMFAIVVACLGFAALDLLLDFPVLLEGELCFF